MPWTPKQEAYLWMNKPDVARKFYEEVGNAPGYRNYLKHRKRRKKTSAEVAAETERTAQELSSLGCQHLAESLRRCMNRLNGGMTRTAQTAQPSWNQQDEMNDLYWQDPMAYDRLPLWQRMLHQTRQTIWGQQVPSNGVGWGGMKDLNERRYYESPQRYPDLKPSGPPIQSSAVAGIRG